MVYPACAGIDLECCKAGFPWRGLPRMRGDRPRVDIAGYAEALFTPHARGSTLLVERLQMERKVYPACAGIDPHLSCGFWARSCLPRMRGDRPIFLISINLLFGFTPHARGSTP